MSSVEYTRTTKKRTSMAPSNIVIQKSQPGSYRSSMSSSSGGGGGGGQTIMRRSNVMSTYGAPMLPAGEASILSKQSVQVVMHGRDEEKKEMNFLNDRFAQYIEKVKYMEAQNLALTEELERCRKMKGYDIDRIKNCYIEEIEDARQTIADLSKELAPLQSKNLALQDKIDTMEDELDALRKNNEDLQKKKKELANMIGDLEGEVASLRIQLESNEQDMNMLRNDCERYKGDNQRFRDDFEAAVTKQINAEQERDALLEKLEFVEEADEKEIEELRALLANFKSVQPDIQAKWKNNFQEVCRALKDEYESRLERVGQDMQSRYDEQIRVIQNGLNRDGTDSAVTKTENKTLKSQMGGFKTDMNRLQLDNDALRRELGALKLKFDEECEECEQEKAELRRNYASKEAEIAEILHDLQTMRNSKMDLELEISMYRKLLESEENSMRSTLERQGRIQSSGGATLAGIISGGGSSSSSSQQQSSNPDISKQSNKKAGNGKLPKSKPENGMSSESTGTVRVTRSTKCAITIKEYALDGSFVKLNNSSKGDTDLSNWVLEKSGPKGKTSSYKFDNNYKLRPNQEVRIFCNMCEDHAEVGDIVAPASTCMAWGLGNGEFRLLDDKKVEKATCKIAYK